jgi:hypothetical protein
MALPAFVLTQLLLKDVQLEEAGVIRVAAVNALFKLVHALPIRNLIEIVASAN